MYTNIFDTHAHYDDEAFGEDADALLSGLPEKGVTGVVTCGINLLSSANALKLANKYDIVYAALGIHPEDAGEERKGDLDLIGQLLESEKKAVAVGEIGLDYHYDDGAPKETQIDLFTRQIDLAKQMDLPVLIHDREAHEDTMKILKDQKPKGAVHCFSGSAEMAKEIVKLGMFIGIGGVLTFKNARKTVEVVESIPLEFLVLETDAPYLAPVPFRGQRNDSSLICHVAEKVAEIRGIDASEVLMLTEANAKRLFNL